MAFEDLPDGSSSNGASAQQAVDGRLPSSSRSASAPADWPPDGPLDLGRHDLPHASSTTEWWYLNSHFVGPEGRRYSLFAAFFQVVSKVHPDGSVEYAHSLTWGLTDVERREYIARSYVDESAPRIGLERIETGHGAKDERLNRAMTEALKKGRVPRPDRMLVGDITVSPEALRLDYGSCRLEKRDDGRYHLFVSADDGPLLADLVFTPTKGAVRHGDNGLVRGVYGEDMFYYFIPRCEVVGTLSVGGERAPVSGLGWYDHEFGRPPPGRAQAAQETRRDFDLMAWNWLSIQLDDGSDVSVYELSRTDSKTAVDRCAVIVDRAGQRSVFSDFNLETSDDWQSTRTFERYPTRLRLEVPRAHLRLDLRAAFGDQELVTVMSKPAFWEGRCEVEGSLGGAVVRGHAYLERSGFCEIETLDDFFKRVGEAVRASVRAVAPLELDRQHALKLIAAPNRERYVDGVDLAQLSRTLVAPVREITDRGGKSWRSYAALACCDAVGGDSRRFAQWLAFPELMHTGSLIVDDVEDRSEVRRGGPAAHLKYGEAIALNAGTAAYFMGERLLNRSLLSDAAKLQLYDHYFEALRAGHAGQALDLDGLADDVPSAIEHGAFDELEQRVLAIHRLKTAAPSASLARMGAVAGGGTTEQIDALGSYFESLGLAFQIIDDVLNLRGFKGDLKQRAEDLRQGKVTLPVAKALRRLEAEARVELWRAVSSRPTDPGVLGDLVERIERCGALDACVTQATELVETAWQRLTPLIDESIPKVMLRAFGWYLLERHY